MSAAHRDGRSADDPRLAGPLDRIVIGGTTRLPTGQDHLIRLHRNTVAVRAAGPSACQIGDGFSSVPAEPGSSPSANIAWIRCRISGVLSARRVGIQRCGALTEEACRRVMWVLSVAQMWPSGGQGAGTDPGHHQCSYPRDGPARGQSPFHRSHRSRRKTRGGAGTSMVAGSAAVEFQTPD